MKRDASFWKDAQFWANIILFLTMLSIFLQTKIALNAYWAKNKPVVGIENASVHFIPPKGDARMGKIVTWSEDTKKFICEDKPMDVQGCIIEVKIKNFGSEPALDFNVDTKLWIGNTFIKTENPESKNYIIMPGQTVVTRPIISAANLQDAYLNKKKIKVTYNFKYSDLTRKKELFEYFAELVVLDNNKITANIINGDFKDKRKSF